MRQYDIVELISKKLINDRLCEAIFLSGMLATNEEDEYCDIDFHVIIDKDQRDNFYANINNILELSKTIISFEVIDDSCIKYLYEDGICLFLYVHDKLALKIPFHYCVIYDPQSLILNATFIEESLSNKEIGEYVNRFSEYTINFVKSYMKKDVVYSFSLLCKMSDCLGIFLRGIDDKAYSSNLLKKCFDNLSLAHKKEYSSIIKELKYNAMISCAHLMWSLFTNEVKALSLEIGEFVNYDLFDCGKRLIFSLER